MKTPDLYENKLGSVNLIASEYGNGKTDLDTLARQLVEKQEAIFKKAIDNHLADWKLSDLEGRLRSTIFSNKLTVYYLDDVAILEIHNPPETWITQKEYSYQINAEIEYKFL